MPKVTVVIPSFNHAKYIAGSIQSVLSQTYQDFEIVVTDDGSSDGTAHVVRTCKDPRIRLFCFERNQGASAALNNCVREAKGEYIAVLSSDDLFRRDKLEKQVLYLSENPRIGAVFSYPQFIDEIGNDIPEGEDPYHGVFEQPNRTRFEWLNQFFFRANALCHPTVLIRKACYEEVGYYDERFAQLPDFDFWIRLCMKYEVHIIPEYLTEFRVFSGEGNASGNRPEANNRLVAEHTYIINNFLRLKSANQLFGVFPEIKTKYADSFDESLVPFYISMLALETESTAHRNFAVFTLFNLLDDRDIRHRVLDKLGFSMVDFIRLTGKYDLFNADFVNTLLQKDRAIVRLDQQVVQLQSAVRVNPKEREQEEHQPARRDKTVSWNFIKHIYRRLGKSFRSNQDRKEISTDPTYQSWISKNEPSPDELKAMAIESKSWSYRPKISLITPVYNTDRDLLIRCIESVLQQTYDQWELCFADGGSSQEYIGQIIKGYARRDSRIRSVFLSQNRGIAGNSNEALKLATGEYLGFLDHDDTLAPFALYEVVNLLNRDPAVDLAYSDEDKVPAAGEQRYEPYFKPEWSPDLFLSYNYVCHFAVIRKTLIDKVGGFREGYDGAQDYDLFLRVIQQTNRIRRIPKVLYHWRAVQGSAAANNLAKPHALYAARKAIGEYLSSRRLDAEVVDGKFPTSYRVKYRIQGQPKVSIIIPTRDKAPLLKRCVSSILSRTEYSEFEILIVDNGSTEQETREYLRAIAEDRKIRVSSYDQPFNFSAINNFAARSTESDILVFLNNDTEVISPEWLSAMLEFAQREDVGAVGAKLFHYDETVQHGGVVLGLGGLADHAHRGFPRQSNGYLGRLNVIQNVSAVTAACMMMRRTVFDEVGGFEEALAYCYNDVDLCLKVREKGYLIVFTPYAELYHHESASGGSHDATPEWRERVTKEQAFIRNKWRDVLAAGDPYYSPNLTLEQYDFSPRL